MKKLLSIVLLTLTMGSNVTAKVLSSKGSLKSYRSPMGSSSHTHSGSGISNKDIKTLNDSKHANKHNNTHAITVNRSINPLQAGWYYKFSPRELLGMAPQDPTTNSTFSYKLIQPYNQNHKSNQKTIVQGSCVKDMCRFKAPSQGGNYHLVVTFSKNKNLTKKITQKKGKNNSTKHAKHLGSNILNQQTYGVRIQNIQQEINQINQMMQNTENQFVQGGVFLSQTN